MSKSLGNAYVLDDLLDKGFSSLDFKFFILRSHYRTLLNFTFEGLQGAAEGRKKIVDFIYRLRSTAGDAPREDSDHVTIALNHFSESLCDDLNTPGALGQLNILVNKLQSVDDGNKMEILSKIYSGAKLLGILNKSPNEWLGYNNQSDDIDLNKIEQLISDRNKFRSEKNYQKSDEIRDELKSIGIEIEDTSDGTKWRKI